MLAIWSLVPLPFLNPAWPSGISWFMYCWNLAWRILSITLLAYEMSAIVRQFEHFWHCLPLGLEGKLTFFQSCDHCWVFRICWNIECSTLTASSFRISSSSTGIASSSLVLFVMMLPKAHLNLHFRMSGSRWAIAHCGYLEEMDWWWWWWCFIRSVKSDSLQLNGL